MTRPSRYSPEVRERAVRMVFEHEREHSSQWSAIVSIATQSGAVHRRRFESGCARLRLTRDGVVD